MHCKPVCRTETKELSEDKRTVRPRPRNLLYNLLPKEKPENGGRIVCMIDWNAGERQKTGILIARLHAFRAARRKM